MGLDPRFLGPWRLPANRVSRFYRGGRLLEAFRGDPDPADGTHPEDWVGSATRAWSRPGDPPSVEGLGMAEVDGTTRRIDDLLAEDPAAVAGAELVAAAGETTGVLVKLLDAGVRLPVHAHPTRAFAQRHLGSFFGKTEAWIITGTRETNDPAGAVVHIGFRRDLGREELRDLVEGERTEDLLTAMHSRPTAAGDVWFIPAGVPHAIGAGVFMVEIEEPTDFSIVAETRDLPIDPVDAHLGLGWDVMIDAFDRSAHKEAWLEGLRHDGRHAAIEGDGWQRRPLTDAAADPFFRAERITIRGEARLDLGPPAFTVGVVTAGRATLSANGRDLQVRAGKTFAIPAAASSDLSIHAAAEMEWIACLPPRPNDLRSA